MSNNHDSNLLDFTKITDETDVKTWIKTQAVTDSFVQNGFRVTWIDWDSDFRNSELQIEDIIIGYDDVSFEPFLEPGKHGSAIGQYGETTYWQKLGGVKHGHAITLNVFRDGKKEIMEIPGKLLAQRFYYDSEDKRALGPGGPQNIARNGFSGSWSSWYEDFVKKMSNILDGGWDRKSINNKKELKEHEEHKKRIDYLQEKHPGSFADIILSDWQKVRNNLLGKQIDGDDINLEYREIGTKRVETVKKEAQIAWNKLQLELKNEMIAAFPTVDVDNRDSVAGKIIELPWITTRKIINDLGQTFAAIGNRNEGYYFVRLSNSSLSVRKFYDAMYRYQSQVSPKLTERYQYLAKITGEPALVTHDRKAVMGLMAEIIAARAGSDGEFFVDLRDADKTNDDEIKFAGQEKVNQFAPIKVKDDAFPQEVIEAMIEAVKLGHEKAWKSLFATWRAHIYWENHVTFDPSYIQRGSFPGAWEQSRRLISDRIYEVRVDKTNTIRRIIQKEDEFGFPDIDEVDVFVDHYELAENGKYRTFLDVNVNRKWTLQRLDEGPWRIITVQAI